jgi:hypothetical protein
VSHLSEDRLIVWAEGGALSANEADHIRSCAECRSEAKALRAIFGDLAELPPPPKALRQATLERIGLKSRRAPARRWGYAWGGLLSAALVLVWARPWTSKESVSPALPAVSTGASKNVLPAAVSSAPKLSPRAAAKVSVPEQSHSVPAPQAPVLAAPAQEIATAPLIRPAVGVGAPAKTAIAPIPVPTEATGGLKSAPSAGAGGSVFQIDQVRGNRLRPALGERVTFNVETGSVGNLDVRVVDGTGRTLAQLYSGPAGPGPVALEWDGGDAPSGAYTVRARFGGTSAHLGVLVVR